MHLQRNENVQSKTAAEFVIMQPETSTDSDMQEEVENDLFNENGSGRCDNVNPPSSTSLSCEFQPPTSLFFRQMSSNINRFVTSSPGDECRSMSNSASNLVEDSNAADVIPMYYDSVGDNMAAINAAALQQYMYHCMTSSYFRSAVDAIKSVDWMSTQHVSGNLYGARAHKFLMEPTTIDIQLTKPSSAPLVNRPSVNEDSLISGKADKTDPSENLYDVTAPHPVSTVSLSQHVRRPEEDSWTLFSPSVSGKPAIMAAQTKRKRKQFLPQQHGLESTRNPAHNDAIDDVGWIDDTMSGSTKHDDEDGHLRKITQTGASYCENRNSNTVLDQIAFRQENEDLCFVQKTKTSTGISNNCVSSRLWSVSPTTKREGRHRQGELLSSPEETVENDDDFLPETDASMGDVDTAAAAATATATDDTGDEFLDDGELQQLAVTLKKEIIGRVDRLVDRAVELFAASQHRQQYLQGNLSLRGSTVHAANSSADERIGTTDRNAKRPDVDWSSSSSHHAATTGSILSESRHQNTTWWPYTAIPAAVNFAAGSPVLPGWRFGADTSFIERLLHPVSQIGPPNCNSRMAPSPTVTEPDDVMLPVDGKSLDVNNANFATRNKKKRMKMSYIRPPITMENHRRAMEPGCTSLGWLAPTCLSAAGTLTNPFMQQQHVGQTSAAVPGLSSSVVLNRTRPTAVHVGPEQEPTNFGWYPIPVEIDPKVDNRLTVGGLSTKQNVGSSSMYFRDKRHNAAAMGSSGSDVTANGGLHTCTLTPVHLRKAKLMFFYVRYPSSSQLRSFYQDVSFNQNNTAQMIKWFSNFREYFYIQIEKCARQALNDGVVDVRDLIVTTDCDLYRILCHHYNRNCHFQVPDSFRSVSEIALHHFHTSLSTGRDRDPSWKKSIYKVIARLDDVLPEWFRTPAPSQAILGPAGTGVDRGGIGSGAAGAWNATSQAERTSDEALPKNDVSLKERENAVSNAV